MNENERFVFKTPLNEQKKASKLTKESEAIADEHCYFAGKEKRIYKSFTDTLQH